MEGGVNAFLRSRPPLDVPPRGFTPSPVVCRAVLRVSIAVCLLLAATYGLSFAGLTLCRFGVVAVVLGVGGMVTLLAVRHESYMPRHFWGPRWPFLAGVPRWIQCGMIVVVLLGVGTIVAGSAFAGDPQIVDGSYVLRVKGEAAQQISAEMYTRVCEAQLRVLASWLLCLWFQAVGLWWCELDRACATTSEAVRPTR